MRPDDIAAMLQLMRYGALVLAAVFACKIVKHFLL